MDSGQTVYRGEVGTVHVTRRGAEVNHYTTTATVTGITVDGVLMARIGDLLIPASEYVATEAEAKQQIIESLVRLAGVVQAKIDTLRDEVLHDLLTEATP